MGGGVNRLGGEVVGGVVEVVGRNREFGGEGVVWGGK